MEQKGCRADSGVPVLQQVTLGETTIGDQVTGDLLAYVVRAEAAVYVDSSNLARVAAKLDAKIIGKTFTIAQRGKGGSVLECDIRPLDALPGDKPAEIGDGKVLDNHVCTRAEPGSCCHVIKEDGTLDYSFKAPSYGMSWCQVDRKELCASWLAQENCETFFFALCQPAPGFTRPITAWVCSIE